MNNTTHTNFPGRGDPKEFPCRYGNDCRRPRAVCHFHHPDEAVQQHRLQEAQREDVLLWTAIKRIHAADYAAAEARDAEARAARAKLDQVRGTMGADAYSGDIGSYVSKSNAVAALARQAQAAEAQGSVISRSSFDSDMGGTSGGYDIGATEVPTQPDYLAKAPPMPKPVDPGMPISDVKSGDPEPNHQAFINKPVSPAIAKNVTNPNKFANFA